jgi:chemotaxis protein MotB
MVTFGDMMCLLMCFFVLLVAFSEMDIQRYRMIAGSMKMAFGVQREFRGMDVPKGVTLLASEFAKGKPAHSPKPLDKKNQIMDGMREAEAGKTDHDTARTEDIEVDTERIVEVLADEVESGIIHVEGLDDRIVIRIDENGIFRAGSATVNPDFRGLLTQLGLVLEDMNGTIAVGGHTDETPIKSTRFRSNWELSSSRAVSVIHVLLEETEIAPYRLLSQGFADSRPLVPNDTPENREMNRRVEISVLRTLDDSNLD